MGSGCRADQTRQAECLTELRDDVELYSIVGGFSARRSSSNVGVIENPIDIAALVMKTANSLKASEAKLPCRGHNYVGYSRAVGNLD